MHKLRRGLFSLTMLIILLTGCNFICRAEESAEKGPAEIGDILYNSFGGDWKPGHTMLYVGWYPDKEPKKENLRVVESLPDMFVKESLRNRYSYDHARTWKQELSAEQRRKISEFVITKIGVWKHCEDLDHTYQKGQDGIHCDCVGLCEAAYESIGLDPVPREGWILWPEEQCKSPRMKDATPVLPEIRLEPSEEGTLKAYASDGDKGSGITMVEFWDGMPDDTPDNYPGKRLGWDAHDEDVGGYYTINYSGTVAQLYAKAFDQAGNTLMSTVLVIEATYVNSANPNQNYLGHPFIEVSQKVRSYGLEQNCRAFVKISQPLNELHVRWMTAVATQAATGVRVNVYAVNSESYDTATITWNNQPPVGPLIWSRDYAIGDHCILASTNSGCCFMQGPISVDPPWDHCYVDWDIPLGGGRAVCVDVKVTGFDWHSLDPCPPAGWDSGGWRWGAAYLFFYLHNIE